MKTTILTAIYNDYDLLKFTKDQSIETNWVCVTDNPSWPVNYNGWNIVYEPRNHIHPNRAAKTPKMLPWLYSWTESSIWIDASFRVISSTFAEESLNCANPIAQFKHPWRDCAYAEAEESLLLTKKYGGEPIQKQIEHLREMDHPENWGLWAAGVIARKHTPEIMRMGFDWLKEVYEFSYQDQISHPDVCRRNGLCPANFPGSYFTGPWVSYEGSGRH